MTATLSIRPGLTMSKMGGVKPKKEAPITEETFGIRKLDIYRQHYDAFYGFRRKRERASRYKRGDQWFELTKDKNGNWVYIQKDMSLIYDDDGFMIKSEITYKMHRGPHVDKLAEYENLDEAMIRRNEAFAKPNNKYGYSTKY